MPATFAQQHLRSVEIPPSPALVTVKLITRKWCMLNVLLCVSIYCLSTWQKKIKS